MLFGKLGKNIIKLYQFWFHIKKKIELYWTIYKFENFSELSGETVISQGWQSFWYRNLEKQSANVFLGLKRVPVKAVYF